MNARDVTAAADAAQIDRTAVCAAIAVLLPILRELVAKRSVLVRWILRSLISALEEYCDSV